MAARRLPRPTVSKFGSQANEKFHLLLYRLGLAHCRHLRTVRTHLSGLVHHNIVPSTEEKLTPERWDQLVNNDGSIRDPQEVFRLVYFGGLEPNLRKKVSVTANDFSIGMSKHQNVDHIEKTTAFSRFGHTFSATTK